ncbi:response regulator [Thiocapsa roseopersicina]|uniref:Response regulator receiver domain-containing protein n=1 Tax=Thiocapsa roseopersicina TaxID=1058 RepID=A0A1H2RRI2_THIRO|nr:response regulator [Thiocapsa roseopersicina]SDW22092.1 Response regulator receiver domain-containing protein [Thiocapsa roseopersicina]
MKILLIDDSRVTRYALRIELKNCGIDVDTADSAEAALEILKSRVPDAIFMDHIMPGLNGLEALEIIRADPRTAHIPIVLCTSQEDSDFAAAARKKGVLTVLPKSLAAERLPEVIECVRAAIDNHTPVAPTPTQAPQAIKPVAAPAIPPRPLSEVELVALIDERLEAGINKRLTILVESLRRDLTEISIAEARHLVEARLAEEHAASAAAPPGASRQDLRELEERLLREILPELIGDRVAASLARQRPEIVEELRQSLPAMTVRPSATDDGADSGEQAPGGSQAGSHRSLSDMEVVDAANRLRDMATTALQSLRAAIKRHDR